MYLNKVESTLYNLSSISNWKEMKNALLLYYLWEVLVLLQENNKKINYFLQVKINFYIS